MPMKSFKYRLYPTKKQAETLQWTLDLCRELYNAALQERRDAWNVCKQHPNFYDVEWRKEHARDYSISYFDQCYSIVGIKHDVRPEFEHIGAHVLQNVLKRVDLAYHGFFRRVKEGKTPGHPRFQGRDRYDSFTYPDSRNWDLEDKILRLNKIGTIKIRLSRPVKGKIKTVTIKREGEHWYVMFACEVPQPEKLPVSYEDVGIDLGVTHLATLSNGEMIEHPRYYRKAKKILEKRQHALSLKKRGSKRRKKAVQQVAKAHRKVRNQRRDFLHKESRKLVNRYQMIALEDIKTGNLTRRPKPKQDVETGQYLSNGASAKAGLNKSILDAGWYTFTEMVSVKAAWAGRVVIFVNPFMTSQVCSGCGQVRKKDLSERWHSCDCGTELDRDINAAINILERGKITLVRKEPTGLSL